MVLTLISNHIAAFERFWLPAGAAVSTVPRPLQHNATREFCAVVNENHKMSTVSSHRARKLTLPNQAGRRLDRKNFTQFFQAAAIVSSDSPSSLAPTSSPSSCAAPT
jgi:hypothetical protein